MRFVLILIVLFTLVSACGNSNTPDQNTSTASSSEVPKEIPASSSSLSKESENSSSQISNSESKEHADAEKTVSTQEKDEQKELPTPTPKSAVIAPTATPLPEVDKDKIATPTAQPEGSSPPAKATSTPTPSPKPFPLDVQFPLDFSPSGRYQNFSSSAQTAFQNAIKVNFDKATQKAGVSAAVFDGTQLWTGAEGKASSTDKMTAETPMIIRSTSKTILGALMVSQVDRGLYSLDDTIESLLANHPDYSLINTPNVNTQVTVRQLLTMTSGIYDWSQPADFNRRISIMADQNWKPANNLKQITKKFTSPGSYKYSYANSILLGLIASHLEKKDLNDIYQDQFFKPLGITAGLLPEIATPENTAIAHDDLSLYQGGTGFGALNTGLAGQFYGLDPKISWAGAGIVSTPENIARWGYELYSSSGSAVSPSVRTKLIEAMTVPTDPGLTSLGMHTYGYYMGTGEVTLPDKSSLKVYTHPGGGGGRTSWIYYSPQLDVSVSLLANSQMLHNPGSCGYKGRVFMTNGECMAGSIFNALKK